MRKQHKLSFEDVAELLRRTPMTRTQLAARLGLTRAAVNGHLQNIRAKHRVVTEGEWDEKTYRVVDGEEARS